MGRIPGNSWIPELGREGIPEGLALGILRIPWEFLRDFSCGNFQGFLGEIPLGIFFRIFLWDFPLEFLGNFFGNSWGISRHSFGVFGIFLWNSWGILLLDFLLKFLGDSFGDSFRIFGIFLFNFWEILWEFLLGFLWDFL